MRDSNNALVMLNYLMVILSYIPFISLWDSKGYGVVEWGEGY